MRLCTSRALKFAFIAEHGAAYPIRLLCRVLGVSASGYYAWRSRRPSRRAERDQALQRRIITIHAESRGIDGSPKVHQQLCQEGWRCSRKRVMRLMRQAKLRAKRHHCRQCTTRRNPTHPVAPNQLQQHFVATCPNQIWLADLTYVPTAEGWLYLHPEGTRVMDLYSRRIVGWAMAARMTDDLTQQALRMALTARTVSPQQLLHHSDQGSQYTSAAYQCLLANHQVRVSMSGVGNCYDNAPMESFFSLLKTELVFHQRYATRQAARTSIFDYIEVFYNRQRIHGALGYLSPDHFEQQFLARHDPATPTADFAASGEAAAAPQR